MESQDSAVSLMSQPSPVSTHQARNKLQSPPPLPASMTPPPSSQKPQLAYHSANPPSLLSSPPPTSRTPPMGTRHFDADAVPYSTADASTADVEELRSMLERITRLYREAKASAAGQCLQYSLLAMERSEQMKRMEVELEMKNKEVEVLQNQARRGGSAFPTPTMTNARLMPMSPSDQQYANLRNRCDVLEIQNEELRFRCDDIRAVMLENEVVLKEENRRLTERIRENRKHLNMLRSADGLIDSTLYSAFATPIAPSRHRQDEFATPKSRRDDPVSQLLLADRMLSYEANSTPSTPTHGQGRQHSSHQRAAHSLSSLPSTPAQARSVPAVPRLQNPLYGAHQSYTPGVPQTAPQQYGHRRRLSRDSTISASDADDQVNLDTGYASSTSSVSSPEHVNESQASQEARNMLRKSSSIAKSVSARSSQRSEAAAKSSGLLQTKLYGPIKKVGAGPGKRMVSDLGSPISAKKSRVGESVGLGIGSWGTSA